MIMKHIGSFFGLPIVNFAPDQGLPDPARQAYRIGDWETKLADRLDAFLQQPDVAEVRALVIGGEQDDVPVHEGYGNVLAALIGAAPKLRNLAAIFIGEITFEECEISWIRQADYSGFLKAFPGLKHLQIRGADGLALGAIDHAKLETLIVESGGLPASVIQSVANATLPALTHLELWLGDENYGFDGSIEDVATLLDPGRFPRLRHLGLVDSEIADEVAVLVASSPILDRLETLDLSQGTLGDEGAEALLASPSIRRLKGLNLKHHYMSPEMVKKFRTIGIPVNVEDPQEETKDGGRFVAVGE